MRLLTCDAEPEALREGLRDLAVASEGKARRTWAVVGPLPGTGREQLMEIGRFVVRLDVGALLVVGEAAPVHAGAVLEGSWGQESRHVPDAQAAVTVLQAEVSDDDVVLVCGCPEAMAVVAALSGGAA